MCEEIVHEEIMCEEMQFNLNEIQALERKYGSVIFRGGLVYLVDAGHSNFNNKAVEMGFKQIQDEETAAKATGERLFVGTDFKREILRCSAELAKFEIWTLFAYIKLHVDVELW